MQAGDRHGEENYSQALFAKGERLFAEEKLDEGLAMFQEGMRYRERNAQAHAYVGLILTQQGQFAAARTEFRTALQIDPKLARAHLGLGVALAGLGQVEEGKRAFEDTLRYDPASVEAHYGLGLVLASLGQNREAIESFDAALQLEPDFGPAKAARAEVRR